MCFKGLGKFSFLFLFSFYLPGVEGWGKELFYTHCLENHAFSNVKRSISQTPRSFSLTPVTPKSSLTSREEINLNCFRESIFALWNSLWPDGEPVENIFDGSQ